jgi:hypothetical protein
VVPTTDGGQIYEAPHDDRHPHKGPTWSAEDHLTSIPK